MDIKEKIICDCARGIFDSVFLVNLPEGTCTDIFSPDDCKITVCYDTLVNKFIQGHTDTGKAKLKEALNLEKVRAELKSKGRYEVIEGTANQPNAGYKILTFLLNGGHATLCCMDFGNIANYYNKKLDYLTNENCRDSLTGAFNRNFYEFNLRDSRISGSVAIIDIDDFKLCNDTYGHDIGDLALTETVKVIIHNIRGKDTLVRIGGDEFLLVLPACSSQRMVSVLEKIRREINAVYHRGFGNFRLSVSIGGVTVKEETVADAVYRADRIMYIAKKQKNTLMTEMQLAQDSGNDPAEKAMRQKLLIVDDSDFNREILSDLLGSGFDILEAVNGEECMAVLEQHGMQISAVLLDIVMPVMDGFSVLKVMNEKHLLYDIPVIIISADDADSNIRRAFEMGAADYIRRPFDAKVVGQRVCNTVKLYAKQRRMLSMLTAQTREKGNNRRIMIDILSNVVGYINGESVEHIQHLKKITAMLLERLILKTDRYGLAWKDCELITSAAMLHDIGKVGIAPEILNKPGKLTPEEFDIMKTHTLVGERILKSGELSAFQNEALLKTAVQVCRWHHERFDGKGYPDGISGENIPIAAQVAGIADVYDALVSKRIYKEAYAPAKAIKMIQNGECGAFNPILVECLLEITDKLAYDVYK